MKHYNVVIVGTGPAALGAAFRLKEHTPNISILMLEQEKYSTGGLRNDCKMNFDHRVGFPKEYWDEPTALMYINAFKQFLNPNILEKKNLDHYLNRVKQFPGVELLSIEQAHYGTDGGKLLIEKYISALKELGVEIKLEAIAGKIEEHSISYLIGTDYIDVSFDYLIVAPGRNGFKYGQKIMHDLNVEYIDNIIDVGFRIETRREAYGIVEDYYDPKFLFPNDVRTFCTNSNRAFVVQEKNGKGYIVNGHAYSANSTVKENGLVNFAMLKTIKFTEPLASGQEYAEELIRMTMLAGQGKPIMQRVGDFRLGKRSKESTFNDFYNFEPTLKATAGDISLVCPAKVLRDVWKSLKILDSIVPGVLNPSTIMYFPEIKFYANKPKFINFNFFVNPYVALIGDGFGTSRGIVGAWASGIRAAEGIILSEIRKKIE